MTNSAGGPTPAGYSLSKNGLSRDANSAGQPAPPGRGSPSCDATFRGRVVPDQPLQNVPRCQYRGHLFKPIAMPIPQRTSTMPNSVVNSLHDANSVNLFYRDANSASLLLSRCQFREFIFLSRCQFRERTRTMPNSVSDSIIFKARVSCDATSRKHSGP